MCDRNPVCVRARARALTGEQEGCKQFTTVRFRATTTMAMNRSANLIGNVPSRKWCPSRGSFSSLPRYNGRCTDSNIVVPSWSWVLLTDSQARSWPDCRWVTIVLFYLRNDRGIEELDVSTCILSSSTNSYSIFFSEHSEFSKPNSSYRLYCCSFYIKFFLKKNIYHAHPSFEHCPRMG